MTFPSMGPRTRRGEFRRCRSPESSCGCALASATAEDLMNRNVIRAIAVVSLGCTKSTPVQPPSFIHRLDVMGIVADNVARPVVNAQVAVSVVDPTLLINAIQVGDCTGMSLLISSPTIL